MSSESTSILLIEDEAHIRKFLRISLEAHGYRIRETRLGADGLEQCATSRPDLVILDLGLPDMDGLRLIPQLRAWSKVPIIVLSVRSDEIEKVAALDAGANDYVTKPFGIAELMARIRALLRSRPEEEGEPPILEAQGLRIDLPRREVSVDGLPVHLTKKEYEVLRLLLSASGRVLTHQQILSQAWGPAHEGSTHYLRVLIGQLREKLGDDAARPRFIATEPGVGYRIVAPVG